ncbi:MAG: SGNH/GDSL hydrolase family protein [Clostridia bacterium]|nr:SGNH/GDSL hydrolase family protein [Clostridia bacterium]
MKKFIAIVLSLVMCLCAVGVSAFAADKPFYLVLGDSIAYGSGLTNAPEACYGKIVADTNGYEYANHAVPGHTTTNLINRLSDPEVIADLEKADIISISIGGNDFLMNNLIDLMFDAMVKNDYTTFDSIAENFYSNFSTIVDIINEHNEDAVILMQTLYNPQSGYLRAPYQQAADRLNSAIERFATENPDEIIIVDVGTALGDDLANFAGDEIHPSVKGNEIIAQTILSTLYDNGLGKSVQPIISVQGENIDIPETFTMFLDICGFIFHFAGTIYSFILGISL